MAGKPFKSEVIAYKIGGGVPLNPLNVRLIPCHQFQSRCMVIYCTRKKSIVTWDLWFEFDPLNDLQCSVNRKYESNSTAVSEPIENIH